MKPTALILCAGFQSRFSSDTPKQLLPIGGQTILSRIIQQLGDAAPVVVAVHPDIAAVAPSCFAPDNRGTILHTLRSTAPLWVGNRIVILLGDVIYTPGTLAGILDDNRPIGFWLNGSEIYALTFDASQKETILEAIRGVISEMPSGEAATNMRLWHLYRRLNGLDVHVHRVLDNSMTGAWVSDGTCDIDSEQAYLDYMRERSP